jgi:hypothetical protein
MYPGSVRSACCGPTMNIREWVPIRATGLIALDAKRVWPTTVRPFCHRIKICSSNLWKVVLLLR